MFFLGQGSSCKLVLIVTLLERHFLQQHPSTKTLRRNTIHQIPCFRVPVSMDLFRFPCQMFGIGQQVPRATEQEALRAQSPPSHWLVPFTTTSQRRNPDGSFPQANLYSLSLVQFKSEVQKQLEKALIEPFVIIRNMSLLFKRLTVVLEAKCLKLPWNPKVIYPNYSHIPSISDEKAHTFSCVAGIT